MPPDLHAWTGYALTTGVWHALARPVVQTQVAALVAVSLAVVVISAPLIAALHDAQRRSIANRRPKHAWGRARRLAAAVRSMLLPTLLFVGFLGLDAGYRSLGLPFGILRAAVGVAATFWLYRAASRSLRLFWSSRVVRGHRTRLLLPAAWVTSLLIAATAFVPLRDLLALRVATVLDTEVTVQAILLVTVGLYFWIEGTLVLENALRSYLSRRRRSGGSLEAVLILGRYAGIVAGLALALRLVGVNATTLGFIWGGLSVGVGFALRGILANFASGLVLLFERSIRPGDLIELEGGTRAFVRRLNVRATEARTLDGKEVIIPNESLLTSRLVNYSRSDRKVRLEVAVSVAYDSDLRKVVGLLEEIARGHPGVLRDPKPLVLFREFGDSGIELALLAWVNDLDFVLRNRLALAVFEAFRREGIVMPFPQREVRVLEAGDAASVKDV